MPNVPTFTTSPSAVPTAAGAPVVDINQGGGPFVQQANAGRALSNAADSFAQKYIGAKMEVAAADQTSELSKAVREIEFKASKIPDRALATQTYDTETSALMEKWSQGDNNFFVKSKVQSWLQNEVALRRASAQGQAFTLESQTQLGKLDEQLNDIAKEAAHIGDPRLLEEKLKQGQDYIDGRVAGGWMNPEAGAQRKIMFQSATFKNIIQTAMARDPAEGVAAFKKYEGKLSAGDQQALRVQAAAAEKGVAIDNAASGLLAGAPGTVSSVMAPILAQFPELQGRITSTDRGHAHNAAVGGVSNSMHLQAGRAMDISLAGMDEVAKQKVLDAILANPNIRGFGYYPQSESIHVDTRTGSRTAWGADRQSGSVGKDWPTWMTGKVQDWQKSGSSGDDFAKYQVESLGKIAAYVANPANGTERFAVAAKAQSVLSAETAHNSAQKKQVTDEFDLAMTNLAIRQKNYAPGTLNALADRMQAAGDHSMAMIYRDLAQNEEELKNFWQLPPARQSQYAHSIPGEAGRQIRGVLESRSKVQTEAMRSGNEQLRIVQSAISQKDNPSIAEANAAEAIRQFTLANRPDLARRVQEDFLGHAQGYAMGKGTPTQLEETRRRLQSIVDQGGEGLRTTLAIQKTFESIAAQSREQWKHSPLEAYANMSGVTLGTLADPNDPGQLKEFLANRSVIAKASQTAQFDGAPLIPRNQMVGPLTPGEVSVFKQGLQQGNLQQVQGTAAAWAAAAPSYMIGPLVKQLSGDEFGNALGQAMWLYKRDQPGDRDTADLILKGSDLRRKGGPEMKGMVNEGDAPVRATIATYLGNAREAFVSQPETMKQLNDAAVSLYTAMTFGKPDPAFDDRTMNQALSKVYGVRYKGGNGTDVLLPTGVDSNQFRHGIFSLTDADVPALTVGGRALTADMVKRSAKWVTVGDGIYKAQFPDPSGGRMLDIPGPNGTWTIDIRQLASRPRDRAQPTQPFGARGTVDLPNRQGPPAPTAEELAAQRRRDIYQRPDLAP